MDYVEIYGPDTVLSISKRDGELKVGQRIRFIQQQDKDDSLVKQFSSALESGVRFVLIGIPEDLGPRANHGRKGADGGWNAFLTSFVNMQHNEFLQSDKILLLGHVKCQDLMDRTPSDVNELRIACAELDNRVRPILQAVFESYLIPIVIGGGHNNCYPLLSSLAYINQSKVNAINLDPHADFRSIEDGRHSGNGFSYAYNDGILGDYHIVGLNELKNNQNSLNALHEAHFTYDSHQAIFHRRSITYKDALLRALERISSTVFGVELDTDAISGMPVSAYNVCGVSVDLAVEYVYTCACYDNAKYLHICEAAPCQHPGGYDTGVVMAGQVQSLLVATFIQAKTGLT